MGGRVNVDKVHSGMGNDMPDKSSNSRSLDNESLEVVLQTIFSDILERPDHGLDDNFFEAGGDSLSAARSINRIQQRTGQTVRMSLLFERPTARSLAEAMTPMNP